MPKNISEKKIATNRNADFSEKSEKREKNGTSGTGEHTDHAIIV